MSSATTHTPAIALASARRAYDAALQECPHWDYDTSEHVAECCARLARALDTLRAARRAAKDRS